MTRILGIDPGINGALSLLDTDTWSLAITDMPKEPGIAGRTSVSATLTSRVIRATAADYAFIENVHSSPQMGVASAFAFGRGLGILEGAAAATAVLEKPRPQDWKAATKTPKDKNQARARAIQLFPNHAHLFARVKDDGRAESALICIYGAARLQLVPPRPLIIVEFPTCVIA